MSDFGWRLSSDFRLSDYDQRLSRSEVGDFGWRLSDYDRPPSFRVEVRRFSDLLTGWWVPVVAAGGRCRLLWPDLLVVRKSVVFQTVTSVNKKLDKISIKHLTINKTLDIL